MFHATLSNRTLCKRLKNPWVGQRTNDFDDIRGWIKTWNVGHSWTVLINGILEAFPYVSISSQDPMDPSLSQVITHLLKNSFFILEGIILSNVVSMVEGSHPNEKLSLWNDGPSFWFKPNLVFVRLLSNSSGICDSQDADWKMMIFYLFLGIGRSQSRFRLVGRKVFFDLFHRCFEVSDVELFLALSYSFESDDT